MPAAANLTQASQLAMQNAWALYLDPAQRLVVQLGVFLQTLATNVPGSSTDANKRTVTNWIAIGEQLVNSLPIVKGLEKFYHANDVGMLVARICAAAASAQSNGRITAGEAAAILTNYNSAIA